MSTVDEGLARLEGLIEVGSPRLEVHLIKPETAPGPRATRSWLEILQALSPILTPVLVALIGWALVESVNQTLRERQHELATGQAIDRPAPPSGAPAGTR